MALDMDTGDEKEIDWHLLNKISARDKAIKWFWAAGALLLIGCLIIAGGLLFGREESAEPVEVYGAAEEDQYVYARVQYMSDSFAYYEMMQDMEFYLALDSELMPSVLCIHREDMEVFEPYIDGFYDWYLGFDYRDEPEEYTVYGYAKPYDKELRGYLQELLEAIAGRELTDEEVEELMGPWYVQVGGRQGVFQFFQLAAIFIVGSGFAFLAGAIDFSAWRKFLRELKQSERLQGPVIREDHSIAYGIVGALAGALLSAMIWLVVGASGFPNFWVGGAAIFFSSMGYLMGANDKHPGLGIPISAICSALLLAPAIYLEWCWRYYSNANTGAFGYVPLSRVVRQLPQYLVDSGLWQEMRGEIILGGGALLFGVICDVCFYVSDMRKNKKRGNGNRMM